MSSGLTELENYLLSAFAHGSTLETTLGGMVCALDEDQVGEFVPALHNISAQYHVDRAHSRRLVSVSIPPALNVSPRGLAKSTKAGRSEVRFAINTLVP